MAGISVMLYFGTWRPFLAGCQGKTAIEYMVQNKELEKVFSGFNKAFDHNTFVSEEIRYISAELINQGYNKIEQERAEKLLEFNINGLEKNIEKHPQEIKWRITQGLQYKLLGMSKPIYYDKAEQVFQKIIELTPNRAEPYLEIADIRLRQEKYDESFAFYQKALSLNEDFNRAHWGLSQFYFAIEEQKKGIEEVVKAVGLGYPRKRFNNLRYAQKQDYEDIIEELKKEAEKDIAHKDRYYLAVAIFSFNKFLDVDTTIEYLEKAIGFSPGLERELGDFLEKLKLLRSQGAKFEIKE